MKAELFFPLSWILCIKMGPFIKKHYLTPPPPLHWRNLINLKTSKTFVKMSICYHLYEVSNLNFTWNENIRHPNFPFDIREFLEKAK